MKTVFLTAFAVCASIGIAFAQQSYQITGLLKNQANEKIILTYYDGTKNVTNTVEAVNGAFTLSGQAPDKPVVARLNTGVDRNIYMGEQKNSMYMPSTPLNVVLSPNCKLNITGVADDLDLATVEGDAYNESFNALRKADGPTTKGMIQLQKNMVQLRTMGVKDGLNDIGKQMLANHQELMAIHKKFIKDNPAAFSSVWLLAVTSREYSSAELKEALSGLDVQLQNSYLGAEITSRIKIMSATAMGGAAPEFAKPSPDGKFIALSQFKGKYVLLDFWGSWCAPCRAANPHLKEVYAAYKDKGLEILGVSSEKAPDIEQATALWKKAIEADGLPWPQVLNNEVGMKVDVVKMYGIDAYPTKLLLDKNGNIIARWVGAQSKELDDKLKSIFTN